MRIVECNLYYKGECILSRGYAKPGLKCKGKSLCPFWANKKKVKRKLTAEQKRKFRERMREYWRTH